MTIDEGAAVAHHQIEILPTGDAQYGVTVTDGDVTTHHLVRVPRAMLDDLALGDADPEAVVRQSIEFLLEREPNTSIEREFALPRIAEFFDDYYDELRLRLA